MINLDELSNYYEIFLSIGSGEEINDNYGANYANMPKQVEIEFTKILLLLETYRRPIGDQHA